MEYTDQLKAPHCKSFVQFGCHLEYISKELTQTNVCITLLNLNMTDSCQIVFLKFEVIRIIMWTSFVAK